MNKKPKFRVWSTVRKSWLNSIVIGCDGTPFVFYVEVDDNQKVVNKVFTLNGFDPIIQQYTTANDKNGKEIYDGDILNYRGRVGRVEFFACTYICCWDDQTDDELSNMIIGDIEVIGNIFETPTPIAVPSVEIEDDEEELESCEQCGENAWDGNICHSCGMKDIGE